MLAVCACTLAAWSPTSAEETSAEETSAEETSAAPSSGTIVLHLDNLQNEGRGQLLVFVYQEMDRIEINGTSFLRREVLSVTDDRKTVTLTDVPYGEYAIAVLHDMDKDLQQDANVLGIPREDLGVSNNAKGGPLGGPRWKAAKFAHRAEETPLDITMWRCYR